jgi:hypothetical protein
VYYPGSPCHTTFENGSHCVTRLWMGAFCGRLLVDSKHMLISISCYIVHAAEFLESNREVLSTIPPPQVALAYYRGSADLYMFAE